MQIPYVSFLEFLRYFIPRRAHGAYRFNNFQLFKACGFFTTSRWSFEFHVYRTILFGISQGLRPVVHFANVVIPF